jgi:hypothetical protein
MNTISEQTYTSALEALEKIKDNKLINISFEEWYMIGDSKDDNTSEYNHKRLYLLLQQLKYLIDPLLIDITHIDHNDASDKYFLFTSRYFSILLKEIEQMSYRTFTTPNDSHLMDILNVVDVPLTRYLQKRESEKRKMEDLLESTTMALSDIESQYLFEKPEQIAVPLDDTKKILDPLNDFVKAYKKKIESDDFEMRIALGGIQRKFSNEDTGIVSETTQDSSHYSKDYYIVKIKGDYYYNGNLVEVAKNNEYYTIFELLFEQLPHSGSIRYKDLYKVMRPHFPKIKDSELHKKILRTFGDSQNGFLSNTNITHIGKPILQVERRVGIRFNNQR